MGYGYEVGCRLRVINSQLVCMLQAFGRDWPKNASSVFSVLSVVKNASGRFV